jgi:hypothetical protein
VVLVAQDVDVSDLMFPIFVPQWIFRQGAVDEVSRAMWLDMTSGKLSDTVKARICLTGMSGNTGLISALNV